MTRCRMGGVVLVTEPEVEVPQRDPRRLAAPPRLDQLLGERQQEMELLTCLRRALGLEARCEAQPRDLDFDAYALFLIGVAAERASLRVAIENA